MTAKKKIVLDDSILKEKSVKEFEPFIKEGKIFYTETNSKWLINFDKIPELINIGFNQYMDFLNKYYGKYENWFNWKFNNPCICPFMFIGEKDYPIRCGDV